MHNHIKFKEELTEFIKNNINSNALKVEWQNAIAMTEGFLKDNKHYYVTIFTSHRRAIAIQRNFRNRPKILTAMSTEPCNEHPLSRIGEELNEFNYKDQYVAVLDRIFHINNHKTIWEKLCHNEVFDIWEPLAPFNNLNDKESQMILLLRIFQIDCDLTKQIVRGTRHNSITDETVKFIRQNVNIVRPIIPNNKDDTHSSNYDGELYFEDIIEKIRDAVSPFLNNEELVYNTTPPKGYKEEKSGGTIYRPPVPPEDKRKKYGSAGESDSHLKLKEHVATNPESIGLPRECKVIIERKYPTGDRVDITMESPNGKKYVIEIELSGEEKLLIGAKQLIKYRALELAEERRSLQDDNCIAIIVAYSTNGDDFQKFCLQYGIKFYEVNPSSQ